MTFRLNSTQARILLLLVFFPFIGISQSNIRHYNFTFEDTTHEYFMYRDTVSNPNCIWQVGEPQKTVFTTSVSQPNAIITDTINPYPINDTSSFIIKHQVGGGYLGQGLGHINLSGYYYVNSTTLNDYGKIEISLNNGGSWISLLNDSLVFGQFWPYPLHHALTLTGNSNQWSYFSLDLGQIVHLYNFQPEDTIQYRFTFISDSNYDNMDGLMYDNIRIRDVFAASSIENKIQRNNSFPNPFSNQLTFKLNNEATNLSIYDINGKTVYTTQFQNQSQIKVNTSYFKSGIYFYKMSNENGGVIERGKVVKN